MNSFINQFPYSDFHELNADWLIKIVKAVEAETARLSEEFSKIEILTEEYIQNMINTAIEQNNVILIRRIEDLRTEIYSSMDQMKATITNEYTAFVNQQIQLLKVYVDTQDTNFDLLAKSYADTALTQANDYTDQHVLDYTLMINPITGEYEDVREVVDDIVKYFHTEGALTAYEYDVLELTAAGYDAYELSAYDYDFNGKNLLI